MKYTIKTVILIFTLSVFTLPTQSCAPLTKADKQELKFQKRFMSKAQFKADKKRRRMMNRQR